MARTKKLAAAESRPDMSMSATLGSGPQLTPEQIGALRTKATAVAFGEMIGALLRSERHRKLRLEEVEARIVPAMALGQFAVANVPVPNRPGETAPLGFILWAFVSHEVDERLSRAASAPAPVQPNEWRSGPIPWIVDAAGAPELVRQLLAEVSNRALGGGTPKMPPGIV